jgi:hypothetical protein
LNNPKYQASIAAATETRVIDFKAAMNWRTATKCERFELLKDVAAMANVGSGLLIVGRDGPAHTTGTVSEEDAQSFDPTEVNKVVHKYLSPSHECRVERERVGDDLLIVVDVPEFEATPLIFQETGNCGAKECKNAPHFRAGDIYIRTKAQQTQRVTTADDMRELVSRSIRKTSDELVFSIQRMLTAPQSHEEPLAASPYDAEYAHEENEFFEHHFYPRVMHAGHYDMTVRPVAYQKERLALRDTPRKVRELAYVVGRNGIFDCVPFDGLEGENFSGGSRLWIMKPHWRRVEAVSLYQSGLYRVVRSFQEDFEPNEERSAARFKETDRELWVDVFIETMTMFHLLARNIVRALLTDPDEEVQIDLRVDGLAQRKLDANSPDPLRDFLVGLRGQRGTENVFKFPLRTTLRSLEVEAATLARERCAKILWTFGVANDISLGFQRKLLRNTEPIALP